MSQYEDTIRVALRQGIAVKEAVAKENVAVLGRIASILITAVLGGNTILLCGNGGSAADCQHIAAELVGRYCRQRKGLSAIALTTNTSNLTALGNDFGFEKVFAKQVEALGKPNDVLWAFSTSGESKNVLEAVTAARVAGMVVIAFTGSGGGTLAGCADEVLVVPTESTPNIQEIHISAGHILCGLIEDAVIEASA